MVVVKTDLRLAHFGVRVRDLSIAREWYRKVTGAEVVHDNGAAVFFALDEDHHRFVLMRDALAADDGLVRAGFDHVAFRSPDLASLAARCADLARLGVIPELAVNQGFCCSLFYRDPDGNEIELTADCDADPAICRARLRSPGRDPDIASSCDGVLFDPLEFIEMWQAGASNQALAQVGT